MTACTYIGPEDDYEEQEELEALDDLLQDELLEEAGILTTRINTLDINWGWLPVMLIRRVSGGSNGRRLAGGHS